MASAMLPQTFQLATNPQQSSRLMRLPAELRLGVLELLLRSHPVIKSLAELEDWRRAAGRLARNYDRQISLSSHVLRCCQNLYREASDILYNSNTLSLRFRRLHEDMVCDFFNVSVKIPSHPLDYPKHEFQFAAYQSASRARLLQQPFVYTAQRVLTAFGRVEVVMPSDLPADIFIVCCILRDVCQDKYISIRAESFYSEEPEDVDYWLDCFTHIRCRSIEFNGLARNKTLRIEEFATGDEAVVDLLPAAQELHWFLVQRNMMVEGFEAVATDMTLQDTVGDRTYRGLRLMDRTEQLLTLWHAVFDGDEEAFQAIWLEIISHTRQKLHESLQDYTSTTMRRAQEEIVKIMQRAQEKITDFQKGTNATNEHLAWLARMNLGQIREPESEIRQDEGAPLGID